MQKNDIITLTIESLSNDGNGVGHFEGMAIFVPATAPGDLVRVRIAKCQPRYAFGIVEELLTPSQQRCDDDCTAFPRCGGCDFRRITYEAELAAKRDFVGAALRHIGGLDIPVNEVLRTGITERYRNKVQFPVAQIDGHLRVGFYANRSHRLIPTEDCLLQQSLLNDIAHTACVRLEALGLTAYDEQTGKGTLRHILLRQSAAGAVLLCLVLNAGGFAGEREFASDMARAFPAIVSVVINTNRQRGNVILGDSCRTLLGSGRLDDVLCGVPVSLSPLSFYQVNHAAATLLYETVANLCDLAPSDTLLDLYCGAGTIGLSMAHRVKKLIGVEVMPDAIQDATRAAEAMGYAHCDFMCADAGTAAAKLAQSGTHIDVAITDPPRKGCDAATLAALLSLAPRTIAMVSCDPATLARDLKILCAAGYTPGAAQPVDLFPRTRHVECVVVLTRK